MADNLQQKLIDAVQARFQTINGAGSFYTDLSANVFVWKTGEFTAAELPGVNVSDVSEDITQDFVNTRQDGHELLIEAGAMCAPGTEAMTFARKMCADMCTAIQSDPTWTVSGTRLAFNTILMKKEFGIEQKEKAVAGVKLTFKIQYRTARFDSYTPKNG